MRYFHRLPPLLRVVSILGLLFPVTTIVLLGSLLVARLLYFPQAPVDVNRVLGIVLNLNTLGGTCSLVVHIYSMRFRHPDSGSFPLSTWQSQAQTLALLASLPLCALVLTLVIPSDLPAYFLVIALTTLLAAIVVLVAYLWTIGSAINSGPMRTPQAL